VGKKKDSAREKKKVLLRFLSPQTSLWHHGKGEEREEKGEIPWPVRNREGKESHTTRRKGGGEKKAYRCWPVRRKKLELLH